MNRLLIGDELPGGIRVDGLLGQGGMAEVWRVWNARLSRWEALKWLQPQGSADQTVGPRFLQEARTVARLEHPHIVPIYAISEPPAWPYFTMKLIEGRDLSSLLKDGEVPPGDALRWLAQIGSALDYAHAQGVVHRDIKPANLLIDSEGEARLTDFGIARALDESRQQLTNAETMLGTPEYLSPEQAGSGKPVGPASDQYSLSILAYELFTGSTPFRGPDATTLSLGLAHLRNAPPSPRKLRPTLSRHVESALLRGLSKDPADRFSSCHALVEALSGRGRFGPRPSAVRRTAAGAITVSLLAASGWLGFKQPWRAPAIAKLAAPEKSAPGADTAVQIKRINGDLDKLYIAKKSAEKAVERGEMKEREWNSILSRQAIQTKTLLEKSRKLAADDPRNPDAKALQIELMGYIDPKAASEELKKSLKLFPGNVNLTALEIDLEKMTEEMKK